MKKLILIITIVIFAFAFNDAPGQCSMCKATVESNMKENGDFIGKGLNTGILYLMSIPYLLGAVGIGIYYWHRKKRLMN